MKHEPVRPLLLAGFARTALDRHLSGVVSTIYMRGVANAVGPLVEI